MTSTKMEVDLYLRVREKEGRLYSDDVVARLPFISNGHPLANEWHARSASASRLTRYLSRQPRPLTILELGCGNGWLSNLLSKSVYRVIGADKNLYELKQAAQVFSSNSDLHFLDVDIFSAPFAPGIFDVIVLASMIQYFPDLPALLNILFQYLKPHGEIHIIDSPLYNNDEISDAVQRSRQYYASLGFPEMAEQYFHHRESDLDPFGAKWLYRPRLHAFRWKRLLRSVDSPFPWIVINKQTVQRDATISEAFSRTAKKYDAFADDHPHLTRMRNKVYAHVERFVPKDARMLELNCGTGIDAVELAKRGYTVHATDNAPGMLGQLPEKITRNNVDKKITFQQCSFTELDKVQGAPFDAVFSDLGGLNCIPDLSPVIQQLPNVLHPGGLVTWVLMPPVCLWEMAEIFRGHPHLAFRRFDRNGTRAHLEGLNFTVHYFTPKKVLGWFGDAYDCLMIEGLSIFTPTAESKNFAKRYTRLYRTLSWLDDRLAFRSPWRGWGDFFIITMRYQPK
jgi:ubiquinone/menaquinone biosynthesis C-methylase UbiE